MTVSVIVPVYNVAPYLEMSIRSILDQTLREIEVILVDDGSTDGSSDIVDRLANEDRRVRIVRQANAGAGAARNAGLAIATGKYLFFADPDDFVRSDHLARLVAQADATRADVVSSNYLVYDLSTGRFSQKRIRRRKLRARGRRAFGLSPMVWDKLFRRDFVQACGIVFQEIRKFNDMCFAYEAACRAERIATVDDFGYLYFERRPKSLQNDQTLSPEMIVSVYDELRRRLVFAGLYEPFKDSYEALRAQDVGRRFSDAGSEPELNGGFRKMAYDLKVWRRDAQTRLLLAIKWPQALRVARCFREMANRSVET